MRGDPYESSDAVFGVKESLVVDIKRVADESGFAKEYNAKPTMALLKHDFVLLTEEESNNLKQERAWEQARRQGSLDVRNGVLLPS